MSEQNASGPQGPVGPMPKFTEAILGPEDFLILIPKEPLTPEECARINLDMPNRLKGRVIVVERMDLVVGRPL